MAYKQTDDDANKLSYQDIVFLLKTIYGVKLQKQNRYKEYRYTGVFWYYLIHIDSNDYVLPDAIQLPVLRDFLHSKGFTHDNARTKVFEEFE